MGAPRTSGSKSQWFEAMKGSASGHGVAPVDFDLLMARVQEQARLQLHGTITDIVTADKEFEVPYFFDEFVPVLERHAFEAAVKTHAALQAEVGTDGLLPLLTFHGTQNQRALNSILQHGYLLPGEQHPTEGYSLRIANGSALGVGVYSARTYQTPAWFSFVDGAMKVGDGWGCWVE